RCRRYPGRHGRSGLGVRFYQGVGAFAVSLPQILFSDEKNAGGAKGGGEKRGDARGGGEAAGGGVVRAVSGSGLGHQTAPIGKAGRRLLQRCGLQPRSEERRVGKERRSRLSVEYRKQ